MKVVFLDTKTFGNDMDVKKALSALGEVVTYESTNQTELLSRIQDCDVVMCNKVPLSGEVLAKAPNVKLICVSATGFDPIDVAYCKEHHIGVCNVVGYSTDNVAQVTVGLALSLVNRLPEFCEYTRNGSYSAGGVANHILPYHELAGKTWGIVGLGNIGKKVAKVAEALGCKVLAFKRTPDPNYPCVSLETLCKESDILSIHTPLSKETRNLIGEKEIAWMKPSCIVINVARGAVTDEKALADAIRSHRLGGLGVDVYSQEPYPTEHPFTEIAGLPNVLLTPHMAWASVEARYRCLAEMVENAKVFFAGGIRNRVDL